MLLLSVKLENIRSYLNQEIRFPKGSTLLSGDIGSGKSTILLAIEFALFGIRRLHLSGESLLRHGKAQGSVSLQFNIDGKEVIIKRTLKRGKKSVEQDSGYIIIDGIKKQGTAVELKSIILDLLGYPKELVTKTKNLVYRYTVYTPQEAMKEILIEDVEARLDTLRKVFGIDKYKRIGENSLIVIRNIKEKRKELLGMISDLEQKRQNKQQTEKERAELENQLEELVPQLEKAEKELKEKQEAVGKVEAEISEYHSLKREKGLVDLNEKNKHDIFVNIKSELENAEKSISDLQNELGGKESKDLADLDKMVNAKTEVIAKTEATLKEISNSLQTLKIKKRSSEEVKNKIMQISRCPVCEQEVGDSHKEAISQREGSNIHEYEEGISHYMKEEQNLEKQMSLLKQELQKLEHVRHGFALIALKERDLKEKLQSKEQLIAKQQEIKKDIGELYEQKQALQEKLTRFQDIEKTYQQLRGEVDKALQQERKLAIAKTAKERDIRGVQRTINLLHKEIKSKLQSQEKLQNLGELLTWFEEGFVKLTAAMERQVMLSVYHEFNELFQQWFSVLMEEETLSVRLDDSFTPIVVQNGYEISIDHLSGGERTAAALAYRLALNKVVNDLMNSIKTKDLIILDEPTDGFSADQLDRVREVLDQIGTKQTIIVSHEHKIESFVDQVIRISKNEQVSKVLE